MAYEIIEGDCIEAMRGMPDASVDAVVCDPPYELGFMGKSWDAKGIAFDPATWAEALRVLKPGGHLLAFSGTRTSHRMVCAIEDAGFEIRDSIVWMYGSGFPKSHNLPGGLGTALKPAHEPICVARKPLIGTVAANVALHGTGALNIDASRIGTVEPLVRPSIVREDNTTYGHGLGAGTQTEPQGRWPANVILDEEAGRLLDEQSGNLAPGAWAKGKIARKGVGTVPFGTDSFNPERRETGSGGASRFFYCAKASSAERNAGCEGLHEQIWVQFQTGNGTSGKASSISAGRDTRHRNTHPTVKPIALMRYLCRLVTPPGGTVLDPFAGSGTTGIACAQEGFAFIGIEQSAEYCAIARRRIAHIEAELKRQPALLF